MENNKLKKSLVLGKTKYKLLIFILLSIFVIFNNFEVYFDLECGIATASNLNIISTIIYLAVVGLCVFLLDIKYSFIYVILEIIFPYIVIMLKGRSLSDFNFVAYNYEILVFKIIFLIVLVLTLTNIIKNKLFISYIAFTMLNVILINLLIYCIGEYNAFSITDFLHETVFFSFMILIGVVLDEKDKHYEEDRYSKIMISATSITFSVLVICLNVNISLANYLQNTGKAIMILILFAIAIFSMLYAIKPTLKLFNANNTDDEEKKKACFYITDNIDLFFSILVIGFTTTLYAFIRCIIFNVTSYAELNMIAYVANFIILLLFTLMTIYIGKYYFIHKNDVICTQSNESVECDFEDTIETISENIENIENTEKTEN